MVPSTCVCVGAYKAEMFQRMLRRKRKRSNRHVHFSSLTDIPEDTLDVSIATTDVTEGDGLGEVFAGRNVSQTSMVRNTVNVSEGLCSQVPSPLPPSLPPLSLCRCACVCVALYYTMIGFISRDGCGQCGCGQ